MGMRIAFDHQVFTMQRYGGVSRYYFNLIQELHKLKQEPKVFAGVFQNQYLFQLSDELFNGFQVKKYPRGTGRFFNLGNHFFTQNQIKNFKPDIIHETYYSQLKAKRTKTPRIVTVYDMIHELFPESFSKNDPLSGWKKRSLENADHVISISHHTKADLINLFGLPETKISVVHLASDSVNIAQDKPKNLGIKPFVLYVGARGGYKNFEVLLRAFAKSKKLKENFSLLAFGGGGFNSSEISKIKEFGLSSEIVRQVSGNDELLKGLYCSAEVFVYPSKYEGFGLPPLEAMACGCPVVSSNTSSMPEVIGDAAAYFSPLELEELISVLERILFDAKMKKDLVTKGYARVKKYSWKKCAEETLQVYKEVIESHEK